MDAKTHGNPCHAWLLAVYYGDLFSALRYFIRVYLFGKKAVSGEKQREKARVSECFQPLAHSDAHSHS